MTILHLKLKKKWFDMIASGEKKEEYRTLNNYWAVRLIGNGCRYKDFDVIEFQNGYAKNSPKITVECLGITDGYGKEKWGAEIGVIYHVILLGKVL
jgi:hypothetical protein